MKKVIVAFDEKPTEAEVKAFEKFQQEMKELGTEVESIGGGVKNPS